MRAELSKMMNVLCEMDSLKDSNSELELDLRRLKSELKRREEKERKNDEVRKELDFYKRENDLLRKVPLYHSIFRILKSATKKMHKFE